MFFEEEIETSDAFREQFTTHGMCWTFNADGSRQVNRTGVCKGFVYILIHVYITYLYMKK